MPYMRQAWSIRDQASPLEAASMLSRAPHNVLYVTRADTMRLVGVITGCDIASIDEKKMSAIDLATTKGVIGIRPDTSIADALLLMHGENSAGKPFRVLPVLNDQKELLGVVSRDELEAAFDSPSSSSSGSPRSFSY